MQNHLSSRLLSKNLKVKLYRTLILPVVLYGRETWSLILRKERTLRVFENRVLRPRHRWEKNIKMDLREVGGGGDWMELAQDRDRWRELVNTVMNFRIP